MKTELLENSSELPAEKHDNPVTNETSSTEGFSESTSEIQARLEKEEAARTEISNKLNSIENESLPVEVKDKLKKLYAEELEGIEQAIASLKKDLSGNS